MDRFLQAAWLVAVAAGIGGCAEPTAIPVPNAGAIVVAAGDGQTAVVGTRLPAALAVVVTAPDGAVAAGLAVRFAVTSGAGTLEPANTETDSLGQAKTLLTLGAAAGVVTISASVTGTNLSAALRATAMAPDPDSTAAAVVYNSDWATASHAASTGDYATVFPQASVNQLDIVLTPAQWASVRANMRRIYGFDFGGDPGIPSVFPEEDPDYVPVLLRFGGKVWKKAGFRLKGVSSLTASWGHGVSKLPFRLKLNEFEKAYPAIKGQRFFGFKELSFSPGYLDPSLIREKVAADLFRAAGIPAARTAFYRVSIDFGEGLKYCGVYTIVETIDDTMIKDQFGEDAGNIYKPESRLQTFRTDQFEKKNNKGPADYTDVKALLAALNVPSRIVNPVPWRAGLEAVFDVDHFLRWLAVSNAIVNWDSYGTLAHNYYLYHHSNGRLTWIPWDHNESLIGNPGVAGVTGAGALKRAGLTLTMNEVETGWPLIRHLADDPVYFARYRALLKEFGSGTLATSATTMLERAHQLIAPYVVGPGGEQPGYTQLTSPAAFPAALDDLKAHITRRRALVSSFVP